MAHNEVLLLQPIEGLGAEGEQVRVKAGYARNFLLPRRMAVPVTQANKKQIESLQKRREIREARELEEARELAGRLEGLSLAFAVKTGEGGKMFGAVTAGNIHEKITEAGIDIDKKKVSLPAPIKTLGRHSLTIKLHPEVEVEVAFEVVSENPIDTSEAAEESAGDEADAAEKAEA
ncbi:MAG: 50S ribosomal protein L9 [Opitutales bacterium]